MCSYCRRYHSNYWKTTLYKWEDLLIAPEQESMLVMKDGTEFYISTITQDLRNGYVILTHKRNRHYRRIWRGELEPLISKYEERGWMYDIPM